LPFSDGDGIGARAAIGKAEQSVKTAHTKKVKAFADQKERHFTILIFMEGFNVRKTAFLYEIETLPVLIILRFIPTFTIAMRSQCKYLIIQGIFFFIFCYGFSKPTASDSLFKVIQNSKQDTVRIDALISLAKENEGADFLSYMNEALTLSEKLNYKKGQAAAHAGFAKYFYFKEDYSTSLEHAVSAYNLAREINNHQLIAYSCLYLGFNHVQNQPQVSLEYYLKCVTHAKLAKNPRLEAYGYSAIGNLYEGWYDANNALKYYQQSLEIRKKHGEPEELVSSLIETARAYNRLALYDKSNELIQEGLKIAESNPGNEQNLVYLYEMTGHDLAGRLKDYKKALNSFLMARRVALENNFIDRNNINHLKPIAEMYSKLGDHKHASEYYSLYNELSEAHQKKMDKEMFESQDLLKKELEKEKINAKDAEIALQKLRLKEEKLTQNAYIIGIVILLVLIFFIFRNNILKARLNQTLESKVNERTEALNLANERLRQSEKQLLNINKELETFIYRTSHDLKGPLASCKGLVNLSLRSVSLQEKDQYLKLISTSLDKMDNILLTLYEVSVIRKGAVTLKECNMEEVMKTMIKSFENYPNYEKINFSVDNKISKPFITDEILSQTILRNILENAVKYCQPATEFPFVKIEMTEEGDYNLISVSDNGFGIPKEHQEKIFDVFYRANTETKGSGMGLYIVKNAIDKLNGKIQLASSVVREGTTFHVYFPKHQLN
jgi:signal transduction histidine kinase